MAVSQDTYHIQEEVDNILKTLIKIKAYDIKANAQNSENQIHNFYYQKNLPHHKEEKKNNLYQIKILI